MGERHEERSAPTVNDPIDRFASDYLPKRRPTTIRDYRPVLETWIRSGLSKMMVEHVDVDRLHRRISGRAPYPANRTAAILSKMMNLAVKLGRRADGPVRGSERNRETARAVPVAGGGNRLGEYAFSV